MGPISPFKQAGGKKLGHGKGMLGKGADSKGWGMISPKSIEAHKGGVEVALKKNTKSS